MRTTNLWYCFWTTVGLKVWVRVGVFNWKWTSCHGLGFYLFPLPPLSLPLIPTLGCKQVGGSRPAGCLLSTPVPTSRVNHRSLYSRRPALLMYPTAVPDSLVALPPACSLFLCAGWFWFLHSDFRLNEDLTIFW